MTRPAIVVFAVALAAAGACALVHRRAGDPAGEGLVAFERLDRDVAALLRDGTVFDSPNHPVDRPPAERSAREGGALVLHEGALFAAQLPGRIVGELELELDGAVEAGAAVVRLQSLYAPLKDIEAHAQVDEPLVQRIHQTLLETRWERGGAFRSGFFTGDRRTTWLLLSVESLAGSRVRLRGARLRERIPARPDHHSVGAQSRPSVPIAAGSRASFPLPALPAGATIALGFAPPEGMAPLTGRLVVSCRIEGAGAASIELADGPLADGEPVRRWYDLRFEVQQARPAGTPLEIAVEGPRGTALFAALPRVEAPRDEGSGPNLVLISLDTLRADRVGPERGLTPRLDRLAARSAVFTRCYSPANFTIPAHGSMMTGLQPRVHGAWRFGERVSIRAWPNVAQRCAEAGMTTAAFTAGGFVDAAFGFDRGFGSYRMLDPLMTPRNPRFTRSPRRQMPQWNAALRATAAFEEVPRWIATHSQQRFFLFFHTYHVHDYTPEEATLVARHVVATGEWPSPIDLQTAGSWPDLRGTPQLAHYVQLYDATVAEADAAVGALLDALAMAGILEQTYVIVTADHGEGFLEHDFLFHTTGLHDEVVRVPLIVHGPGVEARTIDTPVLLNDVAPTLLELAGLPPLEEIQGESLVPLLRGGEMEDRPLLIQDCPASGEVHSALVLGRFKYVRRMRPLGDDVRGGDPFVGAGPRPQELASEQLYDLIADPGETHDLAADAGHAATLARARAALDLVLESCEAEALRRAAQLERDGVVGADLDAELFNLGYGR